MIVAARCYASAAYAFMRCLSVCPSVTFVHSVKTSNRIFIRFTVGSQIVLVFAYQTSWRYSDGDSLNGGFECRRCRQESRSGRISGYRSMTAGLLVRTTTATVDHRTDGDASVNLCVSQPCSMDDYDEEKRTEHNLTLRSGKSEAKITNNRRLRSTYCTGFAKLNGASLHF